MNQYSHIHKYIELTWNINVMPCLKSRATKQHTEFLKFTFSILSTEDWKTLVLLLYCTFQEVTISYVVPACLSLQLSLNNYKRRSLVSVKNTLLTRLQERFSGIYGFFSGNRNYAQVRLHSCFVYSLHNITVSCCWFILDLDRPLDWFLARLGPEFDASQCDPQY